MSKDEIAGDAWKVGFTRALIDAIVREGMPVKDDKAAYSSMSWEDWENATDIRREVQRVGVDYTKTTWTESSWDEFMGTFYQGDTRCHGVDAQVFLKSSRKGGRSYTFRWKGTTSDLILAVVRDPS